MSIFKTLITRFIECTGLYRLDLDKPFILPLDQRFELIQLSLEHLEMLEKDIFPHRKSTYPEIIRERLKDKTTEGFGFYDKSTNKIAYTCWIQFSPFYCDELRQMLNFKYDESYIYDGFTSPDFRKMKLHKCMMMQLANYSQQKGCTKSHMIVDCNNIAAINTITPLGYHRLYRRWFIKKGAFTDIFKKLLKKL